MNNIKYIAIALGIGGMLLTNQATMATSKNDKEDKEVKIERCAGIHKKGKADGKTLINGKTVEWIVLPAGACLKLIGGVVLPEKE